MDVGKLDNDKESVRIYFDKKQWNEFSAYEKKRFAVMKRNYEDLVSIGIGAPMPAFMHPIKRKENVFDFQTEAKKKKILPEPAKAKPPCEIREVGASNYQFNRGRGGRKNLEEEFLGNNVRQKQWAPLPPSTSGEGKELDDKIIAILDLYLKRTNRNLELLLKLRKSRISTEDEKLDKEIMSVFEPRKKYPKRAVPKVCYKEEEVSSDDDYIYCEECNQQYERSCPQHGPFVHMLDKKVSKGYDPKHAWSTCPDYMSVSRSAIRGAGLGIWTEKILRKGLVFGPYKGKIVKSRPEARNSGYAWEIRRSGKVLHYIEASDTAHSNWMRFVNCAMTEDRQNLMAFQYHGDIYYRTYKVVNAYTELLVWYGDDFAADLGIYRNGQKMIQHGELKKCDRNGVTSSFAQSSKKSKWTKIETKELNVGKLLCITNSANVPNNGNERQIENRINSEISKGDTRESLNNNNADLVMEESITSRYGGKRVNKENVKGNFRKCPHCDFKTTYSGSFKQHVNAVHYGKRPHQCPHCDYSATQAGNLSNHVNAVHYGKRPHQCSHCDYSATQAVHLSTHVNAVHDVRRPYKCLHCDFRANEAKNLRVHVNAMHEQTKSYECQECDYKTYRPDTLITHTKRIHGGKKKKSTLQKCDYD